MKRAIYHTACIAGLAVYACVYESTFLITLLALMAAVGVWGDYAARRLIDAQREQIELLKGDVLELGGKKWWT